MRYAVQWLRSLVFVGQMYVMLPVIGLLYMPGAILSRKGAVRGCKAYCNWVRWTARWMVGLRTEVRGTPPDGQVLIASKHQSFLDILLIYSELPAGRFIMKREILWTPVVGLYGMRIGCVAVNRGKRGAAIKKMVQDVARGAQKPGQLIIYAQGTRVAPGVKAPYKIGVGVLYEQMGVTCVPAATNVGVFWPKRGIYRRPGVAVVEFLEPIEAGLGKEAFMARLEGEIETASDALLHEAGFAVDERT
ncbi:1-acyl-sn-glycerol-3-phosphate acyltransferase [Roseovarius marisflavi]|uniref:1-acyl-sn-glycerol-3-phosphate acyltransferase n=1 Tax=Roseovarius marisflavi TaxID=1054996 RepID=A0A1M7DNR4_9RHOB|nr:lysophospholipid acyltransferase family protein [Roseovarius marisflavi]SHL81047.1 1-acyl-sn-glycerol-3-phosphate acyltransferase [Roseovarius marisflavi]